MATICIKTINYITTGKYAKYFDLDIGFSPRDYNVVEIAKEDNFDIAIGENDVKLQVHTDVESYYNQLYDINKYIRDVVYVASVEKDLNSYIDIKSNSNNLYSIFSLSDDIVIHGLYDIRDVCVKSMIKGNDGKYVDIYAPQFNSLYSIVQNGNFTYCMTDRLSAAPFYAFSTLDSKRSDEKHDIHDNDYTMQLSSNDIKTITYKAIHDEKDISSNYDIGKTYHGISYNYVLELQNQFAYNNYEDGDVFGDVFPTKNAFNALYSMEMTDSRTLSNARNYNGLGTCGNEVYLKYDTDISYVASDISYGNNYIMNEVHKSQKYPIYGYQKIETLKNINRFAENTSHRSNMYSLKIENTAFDNLDMNDKLKALKQQITMDITNNINEIAKSICPAHTQLLKVEYT